MARYVKFQQFLSFKAWHRFGIALIDHKPSNRSEIERIEKIGGQVSQVSTILFRVLKRVCTGTDLELGLKR